MKDRIEHIIDNCLSSTYSKSCSRHLIASYFDRFRKEESIKRVSMLDEVVFTRMYNRFPTQTELLKIRYW